MICLMPPPVVLAESFEMFETNSAVRAAEMSGKHMIEEMERRGLKPSGFPEDDVKKLQKVRGV